MKRTREGTFLGKWSHRDKMIGRILAVALAVILVAGVCIPAVPEAVRANDQEVAEVQDKEPVCGLEEHEHSDACYESVLICTEDVQGHTHSEACCGEEESLICELEETEGHSHSEDCYIEETQMICGLEETEGHSHGDECYQEEQSLSCTEEDPEHTHGDECYTTERVQVCTLNESEGHAHSDACREVSSVLSCTLEEAEGHTHGAECYATESVVICGLEEGAATHEHTEACYEITDTLRCELEEHVHTEACYEEEIEEPQVVERPAFDQSAQVSGVIVRVHAGEGIFPKEARLSVQSVPGGDQGMVDSAVENERSAGVNVALSYSFDIKVLDGAGNELQPAEGQSVQVSFATAAVGDTNLDVNVYHVDGNGGASTLPAETSGDTVSAQTEGFSYFKVEFTYNSLSYTISAGDSSGFSSTGILDAVGLSGAISAVRFSNSSLIAASDVGDGTWWFNVHEYFTTTETMTLTINGVDYDIAITCGADKYFTYYIDDYNGKHIGATWDEATKTVTLVELTELDPLAIKLENEGLHSIFSQLYHPDYFDVTSIKKVVFATDVVAKDNQCARLFDGLVNLEEIVGLNRLNTSHVTSMQSMFAGCSNLRQLDLSGFNTANVTNMQSMFNGCYRLSTLSGVSAFDTSKVTDLRQMFAGCDNLSEWDLSGYDTRVATDMTGMFANCNHMIKLVTGHTFANSHAEGTAAVFPVDLYDMTNNEDDPDLYSAGALIPDGTGVYVGGRILTFKAGRGEGEDGKQVFGYSLSDKPIKTIDELGFTAPAGEEFSGWNTAADGSGRDYAEDAELEYHFEDPILYAQWDSAGEEAAAKLDFSSDDHGDIGFWRLPGDANADKSIDFQDHVYLIDV